MFRFYFYIFTLLLSLFSHKACTQTQTGKERVIKIYNYFSPDDKPAGKLIDRINRSKKYIKAAVYSFTHKKIAQALVNAQKRGVSVQFVTDSSCIENSYNKTEILTQAGIELFVYNDHPINRRRYNSIMHHKFAIIDDYVWTGSFNWTSSAARKNQENVIVTNDHDTHARYTRQFDILLRRCSGLTKKQDPTPAHQELTDLGPIPTLKDGVIALLLKIKKSLVG